MIWLNNNPISEEGNEEKLFKFIEQNFKNIEVLNSKFTSNLTTWGVKFYTVDMDLEKLKALSDSEIKYIDCSNRNILELDRDLVINIF